MRPGDLARLSLGALGAHRVRTRLTALAVAVGVGAVVLLTTLGASARGYVLDQFAGLGANLCIVLPGKVETGGGAPFASGTTRDLTLADAEAMRRLPRVVAMAPISAGAAVAEANGRERSLVLMGTTPEFLGVRKLRLAAGSNLPAGDPRTPGPACLLGDRARRELFGTSPALGAPIRLGDSRFRVVGLLAPTGQSLGVDFDDTVVVPLASAQRLVNRSGLFRVILEVRNHEEVAAAADEVRRLLAERHRVEDVTVVTQQAVMAGLGNILGLLSAALAAIAAISLGVAAVGVMNVMLVTVAERTPEVGLWMALGASRRQVLAAFLAEAAALSAGGGLAGVLLGFAGGQLVQLLVPVLPVATPLWAAEGAFALAVAVGLAAGVWPAVRAARLAPVDALRGGRR